MCSGQPRGLHGSRTGRSSGPGRGENRLCVMLPTDGGRARTSVASMAKLPFLWRFDVWPAALAHPYRRLGRDAAPRCREAG